jgi:hypothetical protein
MSPLALVFFALFGAVVIGVYISVRRRMAAPGAIATGGVLGGVVTMTLFSLAQGNILAHALLVGLLVGGGLSAAALAIAWYFLGNELRSEYQKSKQDEA